MKNLDPSQLKSPQLMLILVLIGGFLIILFLVTIGENIVKRAPESKIWNNAKINNQ
jgi:uncharacterized protein YneF (UPF0154 family)